MKKMKKVLFWMFLLFLLGLGTAGLKAQVRIGSNTPPNASAVLDLNANDTNSGTLGLALPRVALTSNTMLLSGVTSNLTGMLVYNTSTSGGTGVNTIGIYYWNGATWVRAGLPATSAADSGKTLISTGTSWAVGYQQNVSLRSSLDTLLVHQGGIGFPLTKILDTVFTLPVPMSPYTSISITARGLQREDWCYATATSASSEYVMPRVWASTHNLGIANETGNGYKAGSQTRIFCFRF